MKVTRNAEVLCFPNEGHNVEGEVGDRKHSVNAGAWDCLNLWTQQGEVGL